MCNFYFLDQKPCEPECKAQIQCTWSLENLLLIHKLESGSYRKLEEEESMRSYSCVDSDDKDTKKVYCCKNGEKPPEVYGKISNYNKFLKMKWY